MRHLLRPFRPVLDLNAPGLNVTPNYDLRTKTSMRMRATAAAYAEVNSPEGLLQLVNTLHETELPNFVLGGGQNTLFATSHFEGVVYQLGRGFAHRQFLGNNQIRVGAAMKLPKLLSFARECGLMGLEFLTAVPGTVGGALAGNAGAGNWGLCDFAERVLLLTRDGFLAEVRRNEFRYSYRKSELRDCIILEADLRLEPLHPEESQRRCEEYQAKKKNQPYNKPSCGCIFKNPKCLRSGKAVSAGKLIDEADLKGYHIRAATISGQHANFFINEQDARGEDFLALINLVRDIIYERTGIELQTEVQIVGGPLNSVVLR